MKKVLIIFTGFVLLLLISYFTFKKFLLKIPIKATIVFTKDNKFYIKKIGQKNSRLLTESNPGTFLAFNQNCSKIYFEKDIYDEEERKNSDGGMGPSPKEYRLVSLDSGGIVSEEKTPIKVNPLGENLLLNIPPIRFRGETNLMFSPNSEYYVSDLQKNNQNIIMLSEVKTNKDKTILTTDLIPAYEGEGYYVPKVFWDKESRNFFIISLKRSDPYNEWIFRGNLLKYDINKGSLEEAFGGFLIDPDLAISVSPDGKYLIFIEKIIVSKYQAEYQIKLVDLLTKKMTPLKLSDDLKERGYDFYWLEKENKLIINDRSAAWAIDLETKKTEQFKIIKPLSPSFNRLDIPWSPDNRYYLGQKNSVLYIVNNKTGASFPLENNVNRAYICWQE